MTTLLIEPHYLGSLEYFNLLRKSQKILFEVNQHFTKQTYKNRCEILSAQGVLSLSIPVKYSNRTPLKEVRIDHGQSWKREHWGAIYSAYGKSPFFEFFADYFFEKLERKHKYLLDLNIELLTLCLQLLQIDVTFDLTERYFNEGESAARDMREVIQPKKPFTNRNNYHPYTYSQNFGNEFVPNLSIIDLMFSQGGGSVEILKKSDLAN